MNLILHVYVWGKPIALCVFWSVLFLFRGSSTIRRVTARLGLVCAQEAICPRWNCEVGFSSTKSKPENGEIEIARLFMLDTRSCGFVLSASASAGFTTLTKGPEFSGGSSQIPDDSVDEIS